MHITSWNLRAFKNNHHHHHHHHHQPTLIIISIIIICQLSFRHEKKHTVYINKYLYWKNPHLSPLSFTPSLIFLVGKKNNKKRPNLRPYSVAKRRSKWWSLQWQHPLPAIYPPNFDPCTPAVSAGCEGTTRFGWWVASVPITTGCDR